MQTLALKSTEYNRTGLDHGNSEIAGSNFSWDMSVSRHFLYYVVCRYMFCSR